MTQRDNRYLEAQAGVIGSLLIDAKPLVGEVMHRTQEEDYTGVCRTIYCAIRTLFLAGRPIDSVTILHEVGQEHQQTLLNLMEMTPTAANCMEYIRLTVEESRRARLSALGLAVSGSPTLEAQRSVVSKMERLLGEQPTTRILNMQEGLLDFYDRQRLVPDLIPWGFGPLDDTMRAEPGDMIILGGYPSAGKTAFSLQLALEQARTKRVGYFSLETKPEKLMDRLVATVCGVDFGRIKGHTLTKQDWAECEIQADALTRRNIDLIQSGSMSVVDIQALALAKRYQVIYVDYLQLIEPEDRRRSDVEQVSQISKDLHTMAATTGITVIALSQLSRPEKSGAKEKAPGLHSLRQSGQIEQDADGVMLLYKEAPTMPRSRRCLKIAKNKEGESGGIVMLAFDGSRQRFTLARSTVVTQRDPEYAQMDFTELADNEPPPFDEEVADSGNQQAASAPPAGGGGAAQPSEAAGVGPRAG